MSKVINTKLQSKTKKLKEGKNVKLGPCIFPFKYKGQKYNECFKGSHGDWCATEVNPDKDNLMTAFAFCDTEKQVKKKSIKKKSDKKPVKITVKKSEIKPGKR